MTRAYRTGVRCMMVSLLPAVIVCGCSFFKSADEAMQNISKITKSVEKEAGEKKAQPEATHEGPLLDLKVIALRVQAALKNEGAAFEHVTVDATKDEVVMTGTVASEKARERAVEIARGVDRKGKLRNELRVSR